MVVFVNEGGENEGGEEVIQQQSSSNSSSKAAVVAAEAQALDSMIIAEINADPKEIPVPPPRFETVRRTCRGVS